MSTNSNSNWTEVFTLIDGTRAEHTPTNVTVGSIRAGGNINLATPSLNSMPINGGMISVGVDMTRAEFVGELRRAGIYRGN
jgi:hypothetical protein